VHAGGATRELAGDAEAVRLQAEEHPLIEDAPPANPAEHCLRLMHLRAYDEAVRHASDRDVLDVGCNTGYGTVRFMPVARRVVGTDVSPRAIEAARERAVDGQPEFIETDGFTLPFADRTFDLVTSFQVLEHVPDPLPYLEGLRRVARPDGTVILATPNAATRLDPGMTPWNRFHVREYRAEELRALLESVFGEVRMLGMFGTPTLYQTEIDRVDAARRRMRRLAAAALASKPSSGDGHRRPSSAQARRRPRPLPLRLARAVLPSGARAWLRSTLGAAVAPAPRTTNAPAPADEPAPPTDPPMDLATFLRFTVDDLFYAEHDLDRAMDLLAVCGVAEA
jgi:SAM-dependent methyltransferase